MPRLFINNIKTKDQKGPYKITSDIDTAIYKHSKRIKNKEQWIARVYFDEKITRKHIYTLTGELLYKEYGGTIQLAGKEVKETLCYDYSINKNIKNGTIVKCLFDDCYYIMTNTPNHADIGNSAKFVGVNDYPDNYTIWGVPQHFLSIINEDDIVTNNLGYLYELQKLFNTKKWEELYELRCKLEKEGFR